MQHIFFAPDIAISSELPKEEANHCVRVLRLKEGDYILLTDGYGFFYKAILSCANAKHCRFEVEEKIPSSLPWGSHIHIAMSPTKNLDRTEWFAEKATEIGINEISFLRCKFSERKELKTERIEKILISAMKQSQKASLPSLNEMIDFKDFVKKPFEGQKFIAHCHPGEKKALKDIYLPRNNVLILIGPEGDFSQEEVIEAEKNGFKSISLGNSRLRTETAAIVACHTIHVIQ